MKQNWWCHLLLGRMLSAIAFNCMDLYPILCITCLETVFVLSFAHLHFLFEWLLTIYRWLKDNYYRLNAI